VEGGEPASAAGEDLRLCGGVLLVRERAFGVEVRE
jgi:hypothetical protein